MVVVDTNILAYLLIEGDKTASAQRLWQLDSQWTSDAFILIEFSNLLATHVRTKRLPSSQAARLLEQAEEVFSGKLIEVASLAALEFANKYGVSAYDARYLVAADYFKTRLITEDGRLRRAAPRLTQPLAEL